MEMPELADLIWLFEDEPEGEHDDVPWPVGLHSFRLHRGTSSVLFSLDPTAGEAYISLYAGDDELVTLGRLRPLDRLRIERAEPDIEAMKLWLRGAGEPIVLQTKPLIRLSWDLKALGA
ncbi:hypothetical protein [Nonomuraea africana]|uniref:Uncharacterized protein n=1 Tax=Nonomuraea africana TaxID=46171 RepID=A0ABR9KPJ3_9ACTN|nr:hypothetical protein [Nonomuraea africana]MBE1563944.1 hypothetical protein [Nonomuraea africana]